MTIYIYGLYCPLAEVIRYIGKSTNPAQRLRAHISSAHRNAYDHHTARWIRKLLTLGQRPELRIIREVQPGERWQDVERENIADALASGTHLTNSTLGGEGLDFVVEADRQKYLDNLAAAMRRYRDTPEWEQALALLKEHARSPETNRKRAAAMRRRYQDDAVRTLARAINTEIGGRPEVKAKKSAASKAMWRDPIMREHLLAAFVSDVTKAKRSEKRRAAWANPVVGAKLRAIHASDEVRAKKAEGAIRRATPEYRAMMAEKTRLSWETRQVKGKSR